VRVGNAVAGALAAGIGARLALVAARIPVVNGDEYAIWALRGRALSMLGRLHPDVFLGPRELYAYTSYPLLVPSLIAWSDGWAGHPADAPAKLQVALLVAAMLAATAWVLGRLAGPVAAVAGVLALAATPGMLSHWGLLLLADIPLLAFAVPMALLLMLWVRDQDRMSLAVAGVLGAGAASTKAEGMLFVAAILVGAAVAAPGTRSRLRLAAATACVLSAVLPWTLWTQAHGLTSWIVNSATLSPANLRATLPYAGEVLAGMVRHWPGTWALVAALVPAVPLALARGRGRLVAQLLVTVGLCLAGLWAQYVITALKRGADPATVVTYLDGHFRSTAARVMLVPLMLCALGVPLLAGAALRQRPPPDPLVPDEPLPAPGDEREPVGG
jgi:hypothetical protein